MVNRSSKGMHKKKEYDLSMKVLPIVEVEEEQIPLEPMPSSLDKNPHAVALGRLGGMKGGKARADKLTAEQRSAIARRAASARWQRRAGN